MTIIIKTWPLHCSPKHIVFCVICSTSIIIYFSPTFALNSDVYVISLSNRFIIFHFSYILYLSKLVNNIMSFFQGIYIGDSRDPPEIWKRQGSKGHNLYLTTYLFLHLFSYIYFRIFYFSILSLSCILFVLLLSATVTLRIVQISFKHFLGILSSKHLSNTLCVNVWYSS